MKLSGEARLLAIMACIVLLGGGFLLVSSRNGGGLAPPDTTAMPTPRPVTRAEFDSLFKGSRHVKGNASAPIQIVEFADFECPMCRRTYDRVAHEFGKKIDVRFGFRHFPIPDHQMAIPAAIAVEAAGEQGKFWEMYDALFAGPEQKLSPDYIDGCAKKIGLDMAKFKVDREKPEMGKRVTDDRQAAIDLGISFTPTFLILDTRDQKLTVEIGVRALLARLEGYPGIPALKPEERPTPAPQ